MLYIPPNISKPARYTGIELNRVMKDPEKAIVRFALCYPDIYEVGMSYYGHFLLYEIANSIDGVWCERCFAPWQDMEIYLKENGIPLQTLESKTALNSMDMVGFSLTYELNITNCLNMLRLSDIPIRSDEREAGPIIIGGGPSMLNPLPFERFFDLIVIGEADEIIVDILNNFKWLKGRPRMEIIKGLSCLDGLYSPLFKREAVKRLYIKDLDNSYHPVRPPLPVVGSIHNRLNVEVSRGCGNGCRFCLAGFGYRPYRERSIERVKEIIRAGIENTGYEEVSFLALSSGDYSGIFEAITFIKDRYPGLSVSLPSLKIGSIGEAEIGVIGQIARTGLTFALESASYEIRRRINKDIEVDKLIKELPLLKRCGWRRLKLYLMFGFPWEKEDDIKAIKAIIEPFKREGIEVVLSLSAFIPKPHTPFQWLAMEERRGLEEKLMLIKDTLKRRIKISNRAIEESLIEAIIARGDKDLSGLFEYLSERGVRLEAWREFFRPERYLEWFEENGIDPMQYLGARGLEDELPWGFIDTGIDHAFLREELDKAMKSMVTQGCYSFCAGCGLGCNGFRGKEGQEGASDNVVAKREEAPISLSGQKEVRIALRYSKYNDARYIGHLDTMNILLRGLRATGIKIKTHGKFRPMPVVSLSDAIPVRVESTYEWMDVVIEGGLKSKEWLLEEMNKRLPSGIKVLEIVEASIKDVLKEYLFLLISEDEVDLEGLVKWREKGKKRYYLLNGKWNGKRVKALLQDGRFERIIKVQKRQK